MLGENNIARIFAIILINLPPNVNARTITVTLTVADNDIILEFKKIAILLYYLRKFKKKYHYFYIIYRNTRKQYHLVNTRKKYKYYLRKLKKKYQCCRIIYVNTEILNSAIYE